LNSEFSNLILDNAKRYAKAHRTTLTQLVSVYLHHIPTDVESLDNAPVVRQLTGLLSAEVSVREYKKHLEEKYDQLSPPKFMVLLQEPNTTVYRHDTGAIIIPAR
jgi:hypothetical protein